MATGGQRLDALLAHPDLAHIQFDAAARTFRHRGRVVPGLLRPLKRTLWPTYKYDLANDRATKRYTKRDPTLRSAADGRKRGTRVHLQLEMLTNFGTAAIKKKKKHALDEYTRKFLLALRNYKLRPVVSELTLYDPALDIATKADLICLDAQNRIVLVETKTGYYASWDRACERMRGPAAHLLSDSPRNQALMQLLFTKRMIEQTYNTRVDRAYVIRVDPDGVTPYALPSNIKANGSALAAFVREGLRRTKRRKGPRM